MNFMKQPRHEMSWWTAALVFLFVCVGSWWLWGTSAMLRIGIITIVVTLVILWQESKRRAQRDMEDALRRAQLSRERRHPEEREQR